MDKDHQLDAPSNDSLKNIEQIDNHSELSTIYPHAHQQWEGSELMSRDDREHKRDEAQLRISLTIRRWFLVVGLLVPAPLILIALLLTAGRQYLKPDDMALMIVPVIAAVALVGFISFRIIKFVYSIFYNHAIKATPIVLILILLLGLSLFAVTLGTRPLHTGVILNDLLVISGALLVLSIVYSGILLFIWSSPRIRSVNKIGLLSLIPIGIGVVSWALYSL